VGTLNLGIKSPDPEVLDLAADRENPGWRDAGNSGTKAQCLEYVKEVLTDMRSLSLRKQMDSPS
jgi:hypothetical protein